MSSPSPQAVRHRLRSDLLERTGSFLTNEKLTESVRRYHVSIPARSRANIYSENQHDRGMFSIGSWQACVDCLAKPYTSWFAPDLEFKTRDQQQTPLCLLGEDQPKTKRAQMGRLLASRSFTMKECNKYLVYIVFSM